MMGDCSLLTGRGIPGDASLRVDTLTRGATVTSGGAEYAG